MRLSIAASIVFTGATLLLSGCNDSDQWSWEDGLYYETQKVDWQSSKVTGCKTCTIKKQIAQLPEGPQVTQFIYQHQLWRAQYSHTPINVIRIQQATQSPYFHVEQLSDGSLRLFNDKQSYNAKLNKEVIIRLNGEIYEVIIEHFKAQSGSNQLLPYQADLIYTILKR